MRLSAVRSGTVGIVSRSRSGFTLLEMILALAIFVGAIATLSRLFILAQENAAYAQLYAEGLVVVENRWAQLESADLTLDETGPQADDNYPLWTWQVSSESATYEGLYRVTISATRSTPNQPGDGIVVSLTRFWVEDSELPTADESTSESGSSTTTSSTSGSTAASGSSGS